MDIRHIILVFACLAVMDAAAIDAPKDPQCSACAGCPQERSPVCALERGAEDNFKGFRSMCHLECNNKCREKQFVFVGNGKCGRFRNPQFVPIEPEGQTISASRGSTDAVTATERKRQKLKELQKTKYSVDQ